MIDVETHLRRSLPEVAETQQVPTGFDARVVERVTVHRRRRRTWRAGVATVVVVAVALVGVVATRDTGSKGQKVVAEPGPVKGWQPIADAPIPARTGALSVAMGDRMLVWGGDGVDGAVYDAGSDRWTKVPPAPLPGVGDGVGAWDGLEAIVVAGDATIKGGVAAAAYDPDRNSWRRLADPPLRNAASAADHAVWTGTELVVLGVATEVESVTTSEVAIYDPVADLWRRGTPTPELMPDFGDAVWTGKEIAIVGRVGDGGRGPGTSVLLTYNPTADTWHSMPWGLPGQRTNPVVVWTGSALFVGGGGGNRGDFGSARLRDGALVNVTAGIWEPVPDAPIGFAGSNRFGELWTGESVLSLNTDGAQPVLFSPATRTWSVGTADPDGGRRDEIGPVWLEHPGTAVLWGGGYWKQLEEGIVHCCTPIPGGERYTP